MTGPEHYQAAEELLDVAAKTANGDALERYAVAAAQVHATLALAAATAMDGADPQGVAWLEVTS